MKLVCKILRKHKWNNRTLVCERCHVTQEAVVRKRLDKFWNRKVTLTKLELRDKEVEAYQTGYDTGCRFTKKNERSRAYRIGFRRGGRRVFAHLLDNIGSSDSRSDSSVH